VKDQNNKKEMPTAQKKAKKKAAIKAQAPTQVSQYPIEQSLTSN